MEQVQLFGAKAKHFRQRSRRSRPTKTGFIRFADAHDAAKALRCNGHDVNGRRLSVQAYDSWHQPDAYGSATQEDGQLDEQDATILKLDDHCLEYILRYLALSDHIHFARTCMRFRSVYLQVSPALHKSLPFDALDGMTMWDIRDFFQLSGSHLQHIEGVVPRARCQRLCEYVGLHCANLQSMSITASKFTVRNMRKILAQLKNLQVLKLRACSLNNDNLLALCHLPLLKHLDLSDNPKLTGINMHTLPASLETLILTNCVGLRTFYLSKFCKALPKLKLLDVKYIVTCGLQHIITDKCCDALEELTISVLPEFRYEYIAKLPSLTKLVLYNYERGSLVRADLLNWLVEHKAQQLRHFEVHGQNAISDGMLAKIGQLSALQTLILPHNNGVRDWELSNLKLLQLEQLCLMYWPNLSDAAVLRLFSACPKLRELHLEECTRLTERLLRDIVFKLRIQLRDKENQRRLPIRLHVYGSQINLFSVQQPDVAAKDIIDVSLAPPSTSDLCLVRMPNLLEFDFYSDDYDSFGSDDEVDPHYDRYMYEMGLLTEEDFDYGEMHFNVPARDENLNM